MPRELDAGIEKGSRDPPEETAVPLIDSRVHVERLFFAGIARMGSAGFQPDTSVCILHTACRALEARICGLEARAPRKRSALEGRLP
jgi:hypothetical protein